MAQAADLPAAQPSFSALNVARTRAVARFDPRAEIRGPDTLAEVFLDEAGRQSLLNPAILAVIRQKMADVSPGGYEFFIARTAYLDEIVRQALHDNIPQIVNLGTGYDTRAYRFTDRVRQTRFFELDTPATLDHKRSLLEQGQVTIPAHVTFVPIDFTRESLADVLAAAGYAAGQPTLFIWEGVTYFLPPDAVDATLRFVRDCAGPGSVIGFDYMLPEADLAGRYGAVRSRAAMMAMYTAEPLQFELAPDAVEAFLADRGFAMVEHLATADMERRYLTLAGGSLAGQVLDLFGLVRAVKR